MASTLTYNSLVNSIERYVARNDANLQAQIPYFILFGQRRIANSLDLLGMLTYQSGFLVPTQPDLPKPASWLKTGVFTIGILPPDAPVPLPTTLTVSRMLPKRLYSFAIQYWPDATQVGTPKYYSDDQYWSWNLVPTPDYAYPYNVSYYALPPLLSDTQQTNFFAQNTPQLLLYSCLLETAIYLQDDDRIKSMEFYYSQALNALDEQEKSRLKDNFSVARS